MDTLLWVWLGVGSLVLIGVGALMLSIGNALFKSSGETDESGTAFMLMYFGIICVGLGGLCGLFVFLVDE